MSFNSGDSIEVFRKEKDTGICLWFPAKVIRLYPADCPRDLMYVELEASGNSDNENRPLRAYVLIDEVRPAPPAELHRCFKVDDVVEVFYEEKKGWRKGKVLDILENSKYEVEFCDDENGGSERGVKTVDQWSLRVRRVWDGGSWVPPIELKKLPSEADMTSRGLKVKIKYKRRKSGQSFAAGMMVEIKRREEHFQGSWYPATIVKSLGKDKYLVEYQNLTMENQIDFLKEEADVACIRPHPPEIQRVGPFELFEQVDAWYKNGWWTGHVSRAIGCLSYMVSLSNTNKEMEFKHPNLRPHQEWIDGEWVASPKKVSTQITGNTPELKLRIKCSGIKLEQFSKGMMVEVKSDEEGYRGSWYTAVILGPAGNNNFWVEYQTLKTDDETELLKETARASYIRPCPPLTQQINCFEMLEEVDAWYNEGWWVGVISKVLDGLKYAVYFWTTNEELEFSHRDLRIHQEWIGGKWITDFKKKSNLILKSKIAKFKGQKGQAASCVCFTPGAKVEVTSDEEGYRGSWYSAVIVQDQGNGKYLVQYNTLKTDDESDFLKEEADAQHIRPSPPLLRQTETYRPLEEVDVWYNEGWWVGQVCKVLGYLKYTVYFKTSNELMEFHHSDLRPHQDWINQQWIHTIKGKM